MSTPRTPIDPDAPVLLTGASGYIGSWIVRYLLEADYVTGEIMHVDGGRRIR